MNVLQLTPEYTRDERDFLTPLSLSQRLRKLFAPQAFVAQAYPLNWVPGIDISGIGQTKAIAAAFPQLVAAGWKLLIMRASIGLTVDALFDYFWRAGADAGMYLMVYHLGYAGYSGISQANLFLKTIDPMLTEVDGHSASVLDVETPGDVLAWRGVVTNFYNTTKIVLTSGEYSSVAKWLSCTNNMPVPGFAWNASWSSLTDVPSFAPAIQTRIRQIGVYLKNQPWVPKPPGVNEDVDVNYFMGDEASLRKFLGYDDTPLPPPSDLEARFDALVIANRTEHMKMQDDISKSAISMGLLKERVEILESQPHGYKPVTVPFTLAEKKPARYFNKCDKKGKPIWIIYPSDGSETGERKYFEGTVQVEAGGVVGTGGIIGHRVISPDLVSGTQLFVMEDDRAV